MSNAAKKPNKRPIKTEQRHRTQHGRRGVDPERETNLYNVIYGDADIITRITELSTQKKPAKDLPDAPVSLPLLPLHFDERVYVVTDRKSMQKDGAEVHSGDVLSSRQKPARLIVPSSQRKFRPPMTARSKRPVRRPEPAPPQEEPKPTFSMPETEDEMRKNKIIALHYFDDETYDENLLPLVLRLLEDGEPVYGFTMYTDDMEKLYWKRCRVISYANEKFTIMWEDSGATKEIHRISLKLDIDDEQRFKNRRRQAFEAREAVESELKLYSYVAEVATKQIQPPSAEMIQKITNRLPRHIRLNYRMPDLIQEVVENYQLAEQISRYQDPEMQRELREKGFPSFSFFRSQCRTSGGLSPKALALHMYSPIVQSDLFKIIRDIRSRRLFSDFRKMENVMDVCKFFDIHLKHLDNVVENIVKIDTAFFIAKARDLLTPDYDEYKTLKRCDLWFTDCLVDLILDSLREFVSEMRNSSVRFPMQVDKQLNIIGPARDVIIERGKELLYKMKMCLDDSVRSATFTINRDTNLVIDYGDIGPLFDRMVTAWEDLVVQDYDAFVAVVEDMKSIVSPIQLGKIIMTDYLDLSGFKAELELKERALVRLQDKYRDMQIQTRILFWNACEFEAHVVNQFNTFRNMCCDRVTDCAYEMIHKVDSSTADLRKRCQHDPATIEDFYEKNVLLNDLKANFVTINDDIDAAFRYFDFLDYCYSDTKINISEAYKLKIELRFILDNLPKFQEQGKLDYARLAAEHELDVKALTSETNRILAKIQKFPFRTVYERATEYRMKLAHLNEMYKSAKEKANISMTRDQMLNIPVTEYPSLEEISWYLQRFGDVWMIAEKLQTQAETWMSTPFTELSPKSMVHSISEWKSTMLLRIDEFQRREFDKSIDEILVLGNRMVKELNDLLEHIPILHHLCDPCLRGRHWVQISTITGERINPNEGLTWHWIIESDIEAHISAIAMVAKNAQKEFKIDRTLIEMMNELRTASMSMENGPSGTYTKLCIENPMPVFDMLARHEARIREIFVPPWNKPFITKMKDYELMTQTIRQLITKTLNAQNQMDEISPALESEDVKSQKTEVFNGFTGSAEAFSRIVKKMSKDSSFFEMISNPRYLDVIDEVQDSLKSLRSDLELILAEKRELYPRFKLLSDTQLIQVLASCGDPVKIQDIFGLINSGIHHAVFDGMLCKGLVSRSGEEFNFTKPFRVTPSSIEKTFTDFDTAISQTLKQTLVVLCSGSTFLQTIYRKYPVQIILLYCEVNFCRQMEKYFANVATVFENKRWIEMESNYSMIMTSIENDIKFFTKEGARNPSVITVGLVSALIRHRKIVRELWDAKASSICYEWTKRLRYRVENSQSLTDITVTVEIGPHSVPYGFNYVDNGPWEMITDSVEEIYSGIMCAANYCYNPLLFGSNFTAKAEMLCDFSFRLGQIPLIYECSGEDTPDVIQKIVATARKSHISCIFKGIQFLNDSVLVNIASSLLKGKRDQEWKPVFAAFDSPEGERIPAHMKLLFRSIDVLTQRDNESLKCAMQGVGISQKAPLANAIECVFNEFRFGQNPLHRRIFTLTNIVNLLIQKPIDSDHPLADVCVRFETWYNRSDEGTEMHKYLLKTFGLVPVVDEEEPRQNMTKLDLLVNELVEISQNHRNIIVLGDSMTGKTEIIKSASHKVRGSITTISPYAQDFKYLNGSKIDGIVYNEIDNNVKNQWMVFDGPCEDKWMNVLSLQSSETRMLFFADGSHVVLSDSFRFIFETDSVALMTPTLLSYCSILAVPSGALVIEDLLNRFKKEFKEDTRFVEPIYQRLIGTKIPVDEFLGKIEDFCCLVFRKCLPVGSNLISIGTNFLYIVKALCVSYYYSDVQLSAFVRGERDDMNKNIIEHCIFAAIWAFAGSLDDNNLAMFEISFRDLLFSDPLFRSTKIPKNENLFQYFFDPSKCEWSKFEDINEKDIFGSEKAMIDVAPEHFVISKEVLDRTMYFTDLMLSQNRPLIVYVPSAMERTQMMYLMTNTEYQTVHFAAQVTINDSDAGSLRSALDLSLSGIRDGSRPMIRRPLLCFEHCNMKDTSFVELLRFVIDNEYLHNLRTFQKEFIKGVNYVLFPEVPDHKSRLAGKFFTLKTPETDEFQYAKGIERMLDHFLGDKITKKQEISIAIMNTTRELRSQYRFNIRHVFKFIQRVAISMSYKERDFLIRAIANEAMATFYRPFGTDQILAKMNILIRSIANMEHMETVNVFHDDYFLTNIKSTAFRPFREVSDFQAQPLHSLKQEKYVEHFPLTEIRCDDENELVTLLELAQFVTTPMTHIHVVSEVPKRACDILNDMLSRIKVDCSIFELGQDIQERIHDEFVRAGTNQKHVVLLIKDDEITDDIVDYLERFLVDPQILSAKELLTICTDLNSSADDNDDPFREETIESRETYNIIVREFVRNCKCYFHVVFVTDKTDFRFEAFTHPFAIATSIGNEIEAIVSRYNSHPLSSDVLVRILQRSVSNGVPKRRQLALVKQIMDTCDRIYNVKNSDICDRIDTLKKLRSIMSKTELKLEDTLKEQTNMENDVNSMKIEIEKLMQQTEIAEAEAARQKLVIQEEEKVLKKQEQEAAALQRESEESIASVKKILDNSITELQSLSTRDLSVIKSMNHPPKGVFLVVKSLLIIMGHEVTDKGDEDPGSAPSWIAGRKLLSDTAILSKLSVLSLESLSPSVIKKIRVFLEDPNFTPEVVQSSSTAAKSFCVYIRAIVPFCDAQKMYQEKQALLRESQDQLSILHSKHSDAVMRLHRCNEEFQDISNRSKLLQIKKQNTEDQLAHSREAIVQYQQTMEIMTEFFEKWNHELNVVTRTHETLYPKLLFGSIIMSLYGTFGIGERDRLFAEISKIFNIEGIPGCQSRSETLDIFEEPFTESLKSSGAVIPSEWEENLVLLTENTHSWFVIRDRDRMALGLLRKILQKRTVIMSFKEKEFKAELLDAVQRNDFVLVLDYDLSQCDTYLSEIYYNRGSVWKGFNIPRDFQVGFVSDDEFCPFYAILVDLQMSFEMLVNEVSFCLFTAIESDVHHECQKAWKSVKEAEREMMKSDKELQDYVLGNENDLLSDTVAMKHFHNVTQVTQRNMQNMKRASETFTQLSSTFSMLCKLSNSICKLYESHYGVYRFLDVCQRAIGEVDDSGEIGDKIAAIQREIEKNVFVRTAISVPFNERLNLIDVSSVSEFDAKYPGAISGPQSLDKLMQMTNNQTPVIINCSWSLYRTQIVSDRAIVGSVKECSSSLGTALNLGKQLIVCISDDSQFQLLLSSIAKIISSVSISGDFRFFIFTDFSPSQIHRSGISKLAEYCDFIDFSGPVNIKHVFQWSIKTVPYGFFENPHGGTRWKKYAFLVALFNGAVHSFCSNILQETDFPEESFDVMCQLVLSGYSDACPYACDVVYSHPGVARWFEVIWQNIFKPEHLQAPPTAVAWKYSIPSSYTQGTLGSLCTGFPTIDVDQVFGIVGFEERARANLTRPFSTEQFLRLDQEIYRIVQNDASTRRCAVSDVQLCITRRANGVSIQNVSVVGGVFNGACLSPHDGIAETEEVVVRATADSNEKQHESALFVHSGHTVLLFDTTKAKTRPVLLIKQ